MIYDVNTLIKKSFQDGIVCTTIGSILFISLIISLRISFFLGIGISLGFISGCATSVLLLKNKEILSIYFKKVKIILGYKEFFDETPNECDVCGVTECPRHNLNLVKDSWKLFKIDEELDDSVSKFYESILNNFIVSWFSEFSNDESFIKLIKINLKEATSRLVVKIKEINAPKLITNQLLPCFFSHYELIHKMIEDGISMDKLSANFIQKNQPIHPAVLNRKTEIAYIRDLTNFLIPHLFKNEYIESKIFLSLIRETLVYWTLLPLLDVLSDPNLINLLIINSTNPKKPQTAQTNKHFGIAKSKQRKEVLLLDKFVHKNLIRPTKIFDDYTIENSDYELGRDDVNFLTDQKILYNFMQFLKREGAVDLLRFYMDVDNLNNDLLDPKVTIDPNKLSSLQQQSENLLQNYHKLLLKEADYNPDDITTLSQAHEDVKKRLQGKWKQSFYKTTGYFELLYGTRDAVDSAEEKLSENQSIGPVSRISLKIKGAIRGAVDGAPIEATEVPTVWDGLNEPQLSGTSLNNFVSQKLRKERGQNLDPFMTTLMLSIEQSTDMGEDVIEMKDIGKSRKLRKPGVNLVFGDLFELKTINKLQSTTTLQTHTVKGPSQCFIYILVKILHAPMIIVRFVLALINISQKTVDSIINAVLSKLISIGLYQPRLAQLINLLHEILFVDHFSETTAQELLDRQKLARSRLESIREGLGKVSDTLQSPSLNKHLIYCLFDIIVGDMFPELEQQHNIF